MKKLIIIICCIIFLPIIYFIGLRYGRQQGRVDAAEFKAANLMGRITWIGAYHKGDGIRVGASYKIYAVTRLLDADGRTIYGIAMEGDSISKAASSGVLYLYKVGAKHPIIFK